MLTPKKQQDEIVFNRTLIVCIVHGRKYSVPIAPGSNEIEMQRNFVARLDASGEMMADQKARELVRRAEYHQQLGHAVEFPRSSSPLAVRH